MDGNTLIYVRGKVVAIPTSALMDGAAHLNRARLGRIGGDAHHNDCAEMVAHVLAIMERDAEVRAVEAKATKAIAKSLRHKTKTRKRVPKSPKRKARK